MDLHTDQWWFPDPVNRNDDFLPPGSIKRNKFNIKINENISNNNELISRPAVTNVLIMLNGMSKEMGVRVLSQDLIYLDVIQIKF